MRDLSALADMVVMTVSNAVAPLRERLATVEANNVALLSTVTDFRAQLAASEARHAPPAMDTSLHERTAVNESKIASLQEFERAVGEFREQFLTWRAKTDAAVSPETDVRNQIVAALSPVMERMASLEAGALVVGVGETRKAVEDMRDRLVAVETRQAQPSEAYGNEARTQVLLGPIAERVAASEATLAGLSESLKVVSGLNDRMVALETKAAQPPTGPDVEIQERVRELSAVPGRLATVETRLALLPEAEKAVSELRDRVLRCETKAEAPMASLASDTDLRERVVALEVKTATPAVSEAVIAKIEHRLDAVEAKSVPIVQPDTELRAKVEALGESLGELKPIVTGALSRVDGLERTTADEQRDIAALRERVAVAEVKTGVPGPAGKDGRDGVHGRDGVDGTDGKDGVDGLGFDDVGVDFDGDRTITIKMSRDGRVKAWPIALPYQRYQGVYQDGKSYSHGDTTTWAGSLWHCATPTTSKPGDGSKDWSLIAKRGRDGKDGKDGAQGPAGKDGKPGY